MQSPHQQAHKVWCYLHRLLAMPAFISRFFRLGGLTEEDLQYLSSIGAEVAGPDQNDKYDISYRHRDPQPEICRRLMTMHFRYELRPTYLKTQPDTSKS